MYQKEAGVADRMSSGNEERVKELVSTGCFGSEWNSFFRETVLMKKKKRHPICHLPYSMSNSNYSLYCGSLVMQLISNLVVELCVCVSEYLQ